MIPVTWPEFGRLHPFAPADQTKGYRTRCSLISRSGSPRSPASPRLAAAQRRLAGRIRRPARHPRVPRVRGDGHRNVCLIPTSRARHQPRQRGDGRHEGRRRRLRRERQHRRRRPAAKAAEHAATCPASWSPTRPRTACSRKPSSEICEIVHEHGGQVYMDGANMNAQVGLTSPGHIGADVCHLNLHKTFCIPHGGGGPGMGPIGVAKHLAPFLPSHPRRRGHRRHDASAPSAPRPWGSASILSSLDVHRHDGRRGPASRATEVAILNANYVAKRLERAFRCSTPATGPRRPRVHPRLRPFKKPRASGRGRREAPHGLRLPRAHHELPGGRHADDRAHRERIEGRARSFLRRADRRSTATRSGGSRRARSTSSTTRSSTPRTPPRP
jgi:glycine dehydrogenase